MRIDLSLKNEWLYNGCEVEEVAGRLNLLTPTEKAVGIVGQNIEAALAHSTERNEIVLTGPMAIWAYLVVFHSVVHRFAAVYYDDGRGSVVLIAAHGAR